MPLRVHHKKQNGSQVHLWQISETHDFFISQNTISSSKWDEVSKWKPNRIREWLAGRFLIRQYAHCTSKDLTIDEFGKPQIPLDIELSISHSGEYAAIYTSNHPCGLDIQITNPSIQRIEHKFCTPIDLEVFDSYSKIEALHFIWCAKEAMYKAYGKKEVDYKKHLSLSSSEAGIVGILQKPGVHNSYKLYITKINELYMVYCDQLETS